MLKSKIDWRVERDPKHKGSLRRRLDDAFEGMNCAEVSHAPSDLIAFIFYW